MPGKFDATERLPDAEAAHTALQSATTAEDVKGVFQDFYGKIGHKAIARMLLGQTPEKALRIS